MSASGRCSSLKPNSAFVRVAVMAVACTGALGESCAKAPAIADPSTTTVALADIPTSESYVEAMHWMSRGGLRKAPTAERSVGLVSMQPAQPAFSRPRGEAAGTDPTRSDADLEGWSLAAASLGMMVFMARRRLSD